jgi:hypothetical protein
MSGVYTNGLPLSTLPLNMNGLFPVDTQNLQGLNPESVSVSLSQLASATGLGGSVPVVAGRFYGAPAGVTPVGVLTVTATTYAYPLYIPASTIKTVNISATSGQTGGAGRYALYADNGSGYPGALVSDFGVIGALTGTSVQTVTLATPLALASGLYWVASIFTATSTFPTVTGITASYGNVLPYQLGFDTAAHALATSAEAATGISVAGTYGAFPATFAASATLTLNAATPLAIFGF